MTEERKDTGELPATKSDVQTAAAGDRLVSWLSSGLGALAVVVALCAVILGGAFFTVDRSEAAAKSAAHDEVQLRVRPLEQTVAFNSRQLEFVVVEQREARLDLRAFAQERISGIPAAVFLKPLNPLPDAGP